MAASPAVTNKVAINLKATGFARGNRESLAPEAVRVLEARPERRALEALAAAEAPQVPESPAKSPEVRGKNPGPRARVAEANRLPVSSLVDVFDQMNDIQLHIVGECFPVFNFQETGRVDERCREIFHARPVEG